MPMKPTTTEQTMSHTLRSYFGILAILVAFAFAAARAEAQTTVPPIAPSISLSANGTTDGPVYQGSPIILEASLYHPNL
jgi:hypothetical protein